MSKIVQKIIRVKNKYEYFLKHLELINVFLDKEKKMSKKELEVLTICLIQDKELLKIDLFNKKVRKIVMEELNLKPGGLSNHLKSIVNKGILVKDSTTGVIMLSNAFKNAFSIAENNQGYKLKIHIEDEVK